MSLSQQSTMANVNTGTIEEQEMERILPSLMKKGYIDDTELKNIMCKNTLDARQLMIHKIMLEKEQSTAVEILNIFRRMTSRISAGRNYNAKHPLLNAVIADYIFGFLPMKDILNCRLVCLQWKTVSKNLLQKRVTIKFETSRPSSFLNVFNNSLATDIGFQNFSFSDNGEGWNISEIQSFFDEWGANVKKLTFETKRLFALHKNNFLSSFDITHWILKATNLIKLKVVNNISGEDEDKSTLIVIQLCKLHFIKRLHFKGEGCLISVEDIVDQTQKIQPHKIIVECVNFQRQGNRLNYFCLTDVVDFSQATKIDLSTSAATKTELGINMENSCLNSQYLILWNVDKIQNWIRAAGVIYYFQLQGSNFRDRTRNKLKIQQMSISDSSVHLPALPSTLEKLAIMESVTFYASAKLGCCLPKLRYLHLANFSNFDGMFKIESSNLVEVELGATSLNEEAVTLNVNWIPKSVKRLKINSMKVTISQRYIGFVGMSMRMMDVNIQDALKLDTLILEDYLHCLDTDVKDIVSKLKPSVLVVTCKDENKLINTTTICDFVCTNKHLAKIITGSDFDLHQNNPFDMSVLLHLVKEKANSYIFENVLQSELNKANRNDTKQPA